ncbi:MAG TPA: NfeD family protein [Chloroflexota bacterium]
MAPILQALADPTLAYALFVVGCCALLTEAAHPGAFLPGISGAVCLLLALVGLALLPVNWLSLLLIVAALSLFALDVKLTTHGGLTVAGLAAFAAGSLTLYHVPGNHASVAVPLPLIIALMLGVAALTTFLVRAALRVHHTPSVNGPQRLLGQTGIVTTALAPGGVVRVGGELWSAQLCAAPVPILAPGQRVRVVGRRGLTLEVEPAASAGGSVSRTA